MKATPLLRRMTRPETTLFLIALLSAAYFYQAGGQNENSRLSVVRSIAEHGDLKIERYQNTSDAIQVNGTWYSDKAPGTAFAALTPWIAVDKLLAIFGTGYRAGHLHCYLATLLTVGLISSAALAVWYRVLLKITGSPVTAYVLALAYALGSLALPYSTMLFSHQLTAALLMFSFALLFLSSTNAFAAGALAGYAVTTEYPAAIAAVVFGFYCWRKSKAAKQLLLFGMGIFAGLLPLFAHNSLIFGNPFQISYAAYAADPGAQFADYHRGILGFRWPSLKILAEILVLPKRGLFPACPWLLLVIPALLRLRKNSQFGLELNCAGAIVVLFIVMNASFGDSIQAWGGGAAYGPRHLIAALPFFVLIIAPLLSRRRAWFLFLPLLVVSIVFCLSAAAVNPRTPYGYWDPIGDYNLSRFIAGRYEEGFHGTFSDEPVLDTRLRVNAGQFILPRPYEFWPLLAAWAVLSGAGLWALGGGRVKFSWFVVSSAVSLLCLGIPFVAWREAATVPAGTGGRLCFIRGIPWPKPPASGTPSNFESRDILRCEQTAKISNLWTAWDPPYQEYFSLEWTTVLRIDDPGQYRFTLASDDGSALYLSDRLILNHWGEHLLSFKFSDSVDLQPGRYPLTLRYFNTAGGSQIILGWKKPDGSFGEIPAGHFEQRR